ncbi:hypothetical protein VCRA217O316_30227 [Vibrio crassostreae]|uniref:hypothetical protein n=1 Tax=Vibrio crassostreae TaxID=246167 RepID=UPI000F50DFF0|nr:hypothetical protein [Vibrio crassostreae]ROO65741.1 hypothetical protein EDB58_101537 [Vibrio crassostreae]RPF57318.1 hypothetical protein EDB61_105220 [Vibrio crassostreae]CAK3480205.1 hypothetical protein VCRA217O316_30227 [Vibrio crassostreae]CAK3611168.1 hypothetical protein VCRA217O315_50132 [Vibrio crassostreae]
MGRLINRFFQEHGQGSTRGFILVSDDFEPLNRKPLNGCEWRWIDFEKGLYEEKEISSSDPDFVETYNKVDERRRTLYAQSVDPMLAEAAVKKAQGNEEEAAIYTQQALDLRSKIQAEHPWPTPPELSSEV